MRFRVGAVFVLLCFAELGTALGIAKAWPEAGGSSNAFAEPQYNTGQTNITCSSNDGNRKYCGKYAPSQVSLSKQISGSPCVQGKSWGVDGNGLWVDRGCRATFTIYGNSKWRRFWCAWRRLVASGAGRYLASSE